MKKKLFVGIDFSKETFDVSVIHHENMQSLGYYQFENRKEGYVKLLTLD